MPTKGQPPKPKSRLTLTADEQAGQEALRANTTLTQAELDRLTLQERRIMADPALTEPEKDLAFAYILRQIQGTLGSPPPPPPKGVP